MTLCVLTGSLSRDTVKGKMTSSLRTTGSSRGDWQIQTVRCKSINQSESKCTVSALSQGVAEGAEQRRFEGEKENWRLEVTEENRRGNHSVSKWMLEDTKIERQGSKIIISALFAFMLVGRDII